MEELRGDVKWLGARGIDRGRRGTANAELGGGSSSSLLRASASKEKGEAKLEMSLENDKAELERRRGAIADAWRRSPAASRPDAGRASGRHSAEHEKNSDRI